MNTKLGRKPKYEAYQEAEERKKEVNRNLVEVAIKAKKAGYKSYGQYVGQTEYRPTIERKW